MPDDEPKTPNDGSEWPEQTVSPGPRGGGKAVGREGPNTLQGSSQELEGLQLDPEHEDEGDSSAEPGPDDAVDLPYSIVRLEIAD